jgi:thymidylate synthase
MYLSANTLDDLLRRVYEKLLGKSKSVIPSKGANKEIFGVLLQLTNPRARLSRTDRKGTVFSCLGELLWYLSKGNDLDFISYYLPEYIKSSDDKKSIFGGYGPRLFDMRSQNQISNIVALLKRKPSSRRAVIQLFDAADISEDHNDIPCTCTLQFVVRGNYLHMFTNMRSNDAFKGLPHDVFAFTMLQEMLARTLGCEPGRYKHAVGSLHLYDVDEVKARQYVAEGWQPTQAVSMPAMPPGDPWPSIHWLLGVEAAIRGSKNIDLTCDGIDPYWSDLARLLKIFKYGKEAGQQSSISKLRRNMSSRIFDTYIHKKQEAQRVISTPEQMNLPVEPSDSTNESSGYSKK